MIEASEDCDFCAVSQVSSVGLFPQRGIDLVGVWPGYATDRAQKQLQWCLALQQVHGLVDVCYAEVLG